MTDSDAAAAEARSARIFAEVVLTILELVDLYADENLQMSMDANLATIHRENASQTPTLGTIGTTLGELCQLDATRGLSSLVYSARSRCARDIGNAIRQRFGLQENEEI
jgi:hypothetical protein